jgi:signal transduction histidine kinase
VAALLLVAQRALGVSVALLALPLPSASGDALADEVRFAPDDPIGQALLSEVVQLDGPLLIEDTRAAAPLRGIPVVRGARIMAALAMPIRSVDGSIRGALCVLDGVPRWWSERDLALLAPLTVAIAAVLVPSATPVLAARPEPVVDRTRDVVRHSASSEALAALADHRDGVLLLDREWRVRWANARAAELLAVPVRDGGDVDVRPLLSAAVDDTVAAAWRRALASRTSVTNAWRHPVTQRWLEARVTANGTGLAILLHDVTDARRARDVQALRVRDSQQAELLQAIGQLAGGVAHDFNNLLTVIAANAELLRVVATPADVAQRELDEIERASAQASDLARQLLAFGQLLPTDVVDVDVRHLLGRLESRLRALLPPHVAFESAFDADDAVVQADAELLEEALLAVARNAADAMTDGGVFRLELSRCALADALEAVPDTIPTGAWIVLTVQDTGTGITADALPHVFEPFFTTKGVGRGRGLGLAAVYGIVHQAGGRCTIESEPGRGARVALWLPDRTRPADAP